MENASENSSHASDVNSSSGDLHIKAHFLVGEKRVDQHKNQCHNEIQGQSAKIHQCGENPGQPGHIALQQDENVLTEDP